jgi:hypothetical protein
LSKYVETGVEELDQDKLPILLTTKYQSLEDAKKLLSGCTICEPFPGLKSVLTIKL